MIASNHYEGKGSVRGRDCVNQLIEKKKIKSEKNESKLTQNKNKKKKKNENSDNDDDYNNNNNSDNDDNDNDNERIKRIGDDDDCNTKSIERRDQSFSSLHSVAKLSKAKLGTYVST